MKKLFVKQISLLVVTLMCLSMFGMLTVSASAETKVLYQPTDVLTEESTLGCADIDDLWLAYQETQTVPNYYYATSPRGFQRCLISNINKDDLPLRMGYENGESGNVVLISGDGNGNNLSAFSTDHYSDKLTKNQVQKYEVKVKLSDISDEVYLHMCNPQWALSSYRYDYGVKLNAGKAYVKDLNVGTSMQEMDLAEDLQAGVWYNVVKYYDITNAGYQLQRVLIYRVENNETADEKQVLIGDTGKTWLKVSEDNLSSLSDINTIGEFNIGHAVAASTNAGVMFDDYTAHGVINISDEIGEDIDTDDTMSFYFSDKMTQADINSLTITLDKDGTVNKSFVESENRLDITLSDILYGTDYTLTFSGNVETTSFDFKTVADPKDPYRPQMMLNDKETLSENDTLGSSDIDTLWEHYQTYNALPSYGYFVSPRGFFTYYNSWTESILRIGYEAGNSGNIVLRTGDGASANEVGFFTDHFVDGSSDMLDTYSMHKYEIKLKISNINDVIYPHVSVYNSGGNPATSGTISKEIKLHNGRVYVKNLDVSETEMQEIELSENLTTGVWYNIVKYYDISDDTYQFQRVLIYKVENGVQKLIGDTGSTWLKANNADFKALKDEEKAIGQLYNFAVGNIVEATTADGVMIDDYTAHGVVEKFAALSDDTPTTLGAVAFDFNQDMEASTFDDTKVELKADEKIVELTDVSFNDSTNQLVVTFPELEFETNYTLTFKKDVIKANHADYGLLEMKEDKVFSFATGKDKFTVISKKFLDADGEEIAADTILNKDDVIKASVTVSNVGTAGGEYLIILALYDEDGNMDDVAILPGKVTETSADGVTVTTDTVKVVDANSKASIMVWTNWSDINPRTAQVYLPAQ